ncbi:MAG: LytTR family DNA-binding domain-containing protein, partial [Acidobacteriota bacterium]
MKLRALISDDEASARSRLRKLIAAHPEIEIIGEARDGLQTVSMVEELRPDLLFLDVQMPGLDGFEALHSLAGRARLPLVVFTTAYDEYALNAFEANAVSYLLKPVNRERLAQAVERAMKIHKSSEKSAEEELRIERAAKAALPSINRIIARRRDRFVLIGLDEVFFFRIEDGLVKVKTDGETYWTDYRLNDLEERLPDPPYFRAHRSVIVNLSKVKEIAPLAGSGYLL